MQINGRVPYSPAAVSRFSAQADPMGAESQFVEDLTTYIIPNLRNIVPERAALSAQALAIYYGNLAVANAIKGAGDSIAKALVHQSLQ